MLGKKFVIIVACNHLSVFLLVCEILYSMPIYLTKNLYLLFRISFICGPILDKYLALVNSLMKFTLNIHLTIYMVKSLNMTSFALAVPHLLCNS